MFPPMVAPHLAFWYTIPPRRIKEMLRLFRTRWPHPPLVGVNLSYLPLGGTRLRGVVYAGPHMGGGTPYPLKEPLHMGFSASGQGVWYMVIPNKRGIANPPSNGGNGIWWLPCEGPPLGGLNPPGRSGGMSISVGVHIVAILYFILSYLI